MVALDNKTKRITQKLPKYLGIAIVTGIATWFVVISPIMSRLEKNKFEAALGELSLIVDKDRTAIPDSSGTVTTDKSCGRPNLKYAEGPTSCNVTKKLTYKSVSFDEAKNILEQISSRYTNPLRRGPLMKSTEFSQDVKTNPQYIYQTMDSIKDLNCAITYELVLGNSESDKNDISIIYGCGGLTKYTHYPVET